MTHRSAFAFSHLVVLATVTECVFVAPAQADTIDVPADQPTIQDCIDLAVSAADICVVAPGTYNETIDFLGKAITLRSSGGPRQTAINASGSGTVVKCNSGEGPDTVIEGFTITGGSATNGGGMLNDNGSSPTVVNCIFRSNTASTSGGGMANYNGSNPTIVNCWFGDNDASQGGGVFNFNSSPAIVNSVFTANHATLVSGGLDNSSASNPSLSNCTFSRNSTGGSGGGMTTGSLSNASLRVFNCIFWENVDIGGMDESAQIHVSSSGPTVRSTCIQGLVLGGSFDSGSNTNNTGQIPLFLDADGADDVAGTDDDNLRLSPGSPCIDAGNNTLVPMDEADLNADGDTAEQVPLDLDRIPRFIDDPDTVDTGNGAAPIVDMGAHEFHASIPAASTWGLALLGLLLATAGTAVCARRR